jgi:putative folate metabolism gamma-glutamate ligase
MEVIAYPAPLVKPHMSLWALLESCLPRLTEHIVVAITSKIISLCEGRVVQKSPEVDKKKLIQQEADVYLEETEENLYNISLTIKNRLLIPNAGIDESNGENAYILYPENIQRTATEMWHFLREKHQVKNLGILITDSHTTPLRRGVTGIGLGWCGFSALKNYRGTPDCFGNKLKVTQVNNLDALAAAAVYVMGEGNEQTPFATIQGFSTLEFQQYPPTEAEIKAVSISLEEDLYAPLLTKAKWRRYKS